jgi:hypothetical protein
MLTFGGGLDLMAIGTITALPASPSRLGDPANFVTESLAFLDAQDGFATQCTSIASYLNTAKFDPYNWGDLGPITGSSPVSVMHFINEPPNTLVISGQPLADAVDDLLATFNPFISDANTVCTWMDGEIDPAHPVIVDPARPVVPSVNASPLRNDGAEAFNSKAAAFYGSARSFSVTLQSMADYVAGFSSGYEDWDRIDTTHTETDDWGFIA